MTRIKSWPIALMIVMTSLPLAVESCVPQSKIIRVRSSIYPEVKEFADQAEKRFKSMKNQTMAGDETRVVSQ